MHEDDLRMYIHTYIHTHVPSSGVYGASEDLSLLGSYQPWVGDPPEKTPLRLLLVLLQWADAHRHCYLLVCCCWAFAVPASLQVSALSLWGIKCSELTYRHNVQLHSNTYTYVSMYIRTCVIHMYVYNIMRHVLSGLLKECMEVGTYSLGNAPMLYSGPPLIQTPELQTPLLCRHMSLEPNNPL